MKKELRIKKNEEFSALIKEHHSLADQVFVLYYRTRKADHSRVGISVSKKLGNAPERNKIKRQIRMMFTESYDFASSPYDLVLIVRNGYLDNDYAANKEDLEKLIKKVIMKKYE